MTHSTTAAFPFFGPLAPDWTIDALLEWIGADDARCHEERLRPVLDAATRPLGSSSTPLRGAVVAGVRVLASRVAAEPTLGERTLGALAERQEVVSVDWVLVPV